MIGSKSGRRTAPAILTPMAYFYFIP